MHPSGVIRIVPEAALSTYIKSARSTVEDPSDGQAVTKTIHGKGLRWMAPMKVIHGGKPAAATGQQATMPKPLIGQIAYAPLPRTFHNAVSSGPCRLPTPRFTLGFRAP